MVVVVVWLLPSDRSTGTVLDEEELCPLDALVPEPGRWGIQLAMVS